MEIKIGNKTYRSGKHNMKLLYDLTALRAEIDKRTRISAGDDEEAIAKLVESIDPCLDIDRNVKLVCRYFDNQFTEQEFMEGYSVDSVQDFHNLIQIMTLEAIWGVTNILGGEKKPQTPTSKKVSK